MYAYATNSRSMSLLGLGLAAYVLSPKIFLLAFSRFLAGYQASAAKGWIIRCDLGWTGAYLGKKVNQDE